MIERADLEVFQHDLLDVVRRAREADEETARIFLDFLVDIAAREGGERSVSWKGLAAETIRQAGIYADDGLTYLPYRLADGLTYRTRVVGPDGRRWWLDDGEGQILYGLDRLPSFDADLPVLVTEGETDCLCAREFGYQSLGAPGARSFRPEWKADFERFDLVYAVGDGDQAGLDFAWSVRRTVPWARPVVLPEGRDLRELLQAGDERALHDLLDEADWLAATDWALSTSSTLEEAIDKLTNKAT
jgi:hypothetical protein